LNLKTWIERLEKHAGIGEPVKLTIAFFDSILNGTISDEEFALYIPALRETFPEWFSAACDACPDRLEEFKSRP
jgi:hypothetical protein